jgi:membrane-associated phospholipid phosphatase
MATLSREAEGFKMRQNQWRTWLGRQDWEMYGILVSIFLIWRIGTVGRWSVYCWIFALICLTGVRRDQTEVEWKRFFLFAIPLLGLFYYFYSSGDGIWVHIASKLFKDSSHIFHWDNFMNSIPFNSAGWARAIHFAILDKVMAWVYNYGFVLSLWLCIIRSYWTRDIRKMLSYALAGHLLQFPLILPFYNLFLVHEVWFVRHQPDLLHRTFVNHNELLVNVMNCFPSMHTSISFAMLLLALREKDRFFKTMMVLYCSAIIFSTMYLQIHWVLDVLAGMLFAWGTVKVSDFVLYTVGRKLMPSKLKLFYSGDKKIPV